MIKPPAAPVPRPVPRPAPLHPALAALTADGTPTEEAVVLFVATQTFPLVEPGYVTFAWHGHAEGIDLLRWIHGGVERTAFRQLSGTRLWLLRLPVENEGRFEYKLAVKSGGDEHWNLDALNPATAEDPFGKNSVCRTYGYERPEWSEPRGSPAGRIEDLPVESQAFGQTRVERVYLPPNYQPDGAYPLVIIHDGSDFVTYADLAVSLNNLIADGDIPSLVVALVQTRDRLGEYARGRRHARYLVQELLPLLETRYGVSPDVQQRVLLGASLGAVASLATAFRYPGVFGGLVLKSGSFILDERKLDRRPHPVFQRIARLIKALQRAPALIETRAFVSTGELEGLADENRKLADFLREQGVDVLFKSAWDGHHWHNWRDQLRDGLMWVFRSDDSNQQKKPSETTE